MYRLITVIIYVTSFAKAVYLPEEKEAIILKYDFENDPKGGYKFSFETSNGIKRNEIGQLVSTSKDNEYVAVKGYYSYTDPDGQKWMIVYTADEKGYRAKFSAQEELDDLFPTQEEDNIFQAPAAPAAVPPQVIASLLGR